MMNGRSKTCGKVTPKTKISKSGERTGSKSIKPGRRRVESQARSGTSTKLHSKALKRAMVNAERLMAPSTKMIPIGLVDQQIQEIGG